MRVFQIINFLYIFISISSFSQDAEFVIHSGNLFYKKSQFINAESEYKKVAQDERAQYNLAVSYYRRDQIKEASENFYLISTNENNFNTRALAFYNRGVIFSGQKMIEESIEAYKNALRLNPDDQQARENLQKALMELKKLQPPKKENKDTKTKTPPPQKINKQQSLKKLNELQQKEKQVHEKQQQNKTGNAMPKDW